MNRNDIIVGFGRPDDLHLEALQNRNKTNLLEALGVAPELPIIEEPITPEWKPLTTLAVYKSINLLERMTGVSGFISNMQSIAARPLELAKNRFWGQLETLFLPIKKSLRQVEIEYEKFIRENASGALYGSWIGGAIGSLWGPLGSAVGTFAGTVFGGAIEQFANWLGSLIPKAGSQEEYDEELLLTNYTALNGDDRSSVDRGGAPDYSYIPTPAVMATHETRMAAIRRNQVLSKVTRITMRLY